MLKPDKIRTEYGLDIYEKLIPDSARASKNVASWCKMGQPMKPCNPLVGGKVQGVTVHNTPDLAGVNDDAEQYTRATWPNCNMGGVVVHYYVDDCGAWQNLREDEQGWHAADGSGPGNTTTLAVEIIMDGKGGSADNIAEGGGAQLCAILLHRHGLSIDNLYTHNHWMGQPDRIVPGAAKNCPLYILPHWKAFRAKVQRYLNEIEEEGKMKGIRYIGDFASRVEAATVEALLIRGGHACKVVPYGEKWGVLVTQLRNGVGLQEFIAAVNVFAGTYSCDPAQK